MHINQASETDDESRISYNRLRRDTLSSDAFQRKHRALMYSEDEMRLLGFMDIARRNGTVENEERAEKMSRTFGGENNWNGNKVGRKEENEPDGKQNPEGGPKGSDGRKSVQDEEDVREYAKEKDAAETRRPTKDVKTCRKRRLPNENKRRKTSVQIENKTTRS